MSAATTLAPHHAALIAASGISDAVAAARGYRTVETKAELQRLGFSARQASTPALLLPVHTANGESPFSQIRPDYPRIVNGKPLKYETPRGARMAVDVPPASRPMLGNPAVPTFITEGIRKGDAGASAGLCSVDLIGVWNWRGTNEHGGKTLLADLESIAFNDREVYVSYDSDVMTKPEVRLACERLAAVMRQRGADVRYVLLPAMPDGAKQGLDDYLAVGHTVDDLLRLARRELPDVGRTDDDRSAIPYRATDHGLVWDKATRDGTITTPLTNFAARIVADVAEDDGSESRRAFELEATRAGRVHRFTVPATQFAAMNWPTEHLGASAIVYPGFGAKEHARAAIQILSGEIPERRIYAHSGWRTVDSGQRCYLHAGGAIGADGAVADVDVALPAGLAGFALPETPEGDDLVVAVRASLAFLHLAPPEITYPMLAATYRAAIGPSDLSLHVSGPTGVGKSELAALCQQHFGPAMSARHLPGSWDSTANALEALAHAAKDALFCVDDFMPNARGADAKRLHRDADRLMRGIANGSGRQRMRADTSLRPAKPARGLILSTGEDIPNGQSLRARLLIIEIGPNALDWKQLSDRQNDAGSGLYAAAMAAFVRWQASRFQEQAGDASAVHDDVLELRTKASVSGMHRRTPAIVAQLAVGFRIFLEFATDAKALTAAEADAHWDSAWHALGTAANAQAAQHTAGEPARRFAELVTAAIVSGRAYIASSDGGEPAQPQAWGWQLVTVGTGEYRRDEWRPRGHGIGWLDGNDLYLERDAAYAAARSLGRDSGDEFTITRDTLAKRLHERGYLAATEQRHGELTVRKVLDGQRRRVWHLHSASLYPAQESGQSGHPPVAVPEWPDQWPDRWPDQEQSAAESGQPEPHADAETSTDGRIGRIPNAVDGDYLHGMPSLPGSGRSWPGRSQNPATDPATIDDEHCCRCGTFLYEPQPGGLCRTCIDRSAA